VSTGPPVWSTTIVRGFAAATASISASRSTLSDCEQFSPRHALSEPSGDLDASHHGRCAGSPQRPAAPAGAAATAPASTTSPTPIPRIAVRW
jgi:hypothetical protein